MGRPARWILLVGLAGGCSSMGGVGLGDGTGESGQDGVFNDEPAAGTGADDGQEPTADGQGASDGAGADTVADDSGDSVADDSGDTGDDGDTDDDAGTEDTTDDGSSDEESTGDAPVDPWLACEQPNPAPCDMLDGLEVYCAPPGATVVVGGELTNPAAVGEPVAMGVGAPMLGYIPVSWPFTCAPEGCVGAVGIGNSALSGGKICELTFAIGPTVGVGAFTIAVDPDAPEGDWLFGFTATSGTQPGTPNFYVRVQLPAPG